MEMIKSVQQLGQIMVNKIGAAVQEECWVVGLSTQMTVLTMQRVALGSVDHVDVQPRDIFRPLIAMNVYGFVIIHNHPSNNLNLSENDEKFKIQIEICSKIIQCHFLDFIVVTRQEFISQRSINRMPQISLAEVILPFTDSVGLC